MCLYVGREVRTGDEGAEESRGDNRRQHGAGEGG